MPELSMNTGVARNQAQALDEAAKKIKTAKGNIDSAVQELKSSWWGPDQEQFASAWNNDHSQKLVTAAKNLTTAANDVRQNAKQQDTTSSN
jgi:uncharacterized protein YukE